MVDERHRWNRTNRLLARRSCVPPAEREQLARLIEDEFGVE